MTPNLLPILRVGTPDDRSALRVYDVIHLSPPPPTE